jgi:hypothetical protein
VDDSYHNALEDLFFFNPMQARYSSRIMKVIDQYGPPQIIRKGGKITMNIQGQPDCRCVTAFYGPKLVGIMLYIPVSSSRLNILHIAVDADCTQGGDRDTMDLVPEMLRAVKTDSGPDQPYEYFICYTGRSVKL